MQPFNRESITKLLLWYFIKLLAEPRGKVRSRAELSWKKEALSTPYIIGYLSVRIQMQAQIIYCKLKYENIQIVKKPVSKA